MEQKLKILMLEDLPRDIKLVRKTLRSAGIYFKAHIVVNKKDFENELQEFVPDIIIADQSLANFNAAEALKIYSSGGFIQPFIVLAEKDSVAFAVESVKHGAWDYILKNCMERLPVSVTTGMEAFKIKSEKISADNEQKKSEPYYRQIVKTIPGNLLQSGKKKDNPAKNITQTALQKRYELISASEKLMKSAEKLANFGSWEADLVTNTINCSGEICKIYGYEPAQCQPSREIFLRHVHPDDLSNIQQLFNTAREQSLQKLEFRIIDNNGILKYIRAEHTIDYNDLGIPVKVSGFNMDVTEKKIAELQLIESHRKYYAIIENSQNSFFLTNSDGDILDTNKAACEMFGYTQDEFEKMNWRTIIENEDPRFIISTQYLKRTGNTKGEVTGIKKNGKRFMIEFTSTVFFGIAGEERISSLMSDITLRKQQEESFIKSNERYTHVSKATFNAIWDWDVKTKELYFGDGYKELFGYDITNGTFFTWADNIHPADRERVVKFRLNKIIQDDVFNWADEYRYIRADGSVADVLDRGILLKDAKGTYRMIGAMQDVTELKNNEISIRQLNNTLEIKAKELANSNEELERFAYVASHDLQEPLRMINGFLQLLRKKYTHQLDETAQKYIDFAVDGAGRMKNLIFDLLEYSRIGSYKEAHTLIDVNEILRKTLHDLHSSATEAKAVITVATLPHIAGNKFQLTRLFQNLISNALKYKASSNPAIEVGYIERDDEWEFFVKDNGIGIDPKYFKKIFIIFQRLHGRNEYNGTGIGLAICKKIVELHGGRIWVESSGEGSEFRFTTSKIQAPDAVVQEIFSADLLDNDIN